MKSLQIFLFKYLVRVSSRPELGFLGRIIRRKKFIKKIKPGQQIEVGGGERCLGTAAFIHTCHSLCQSLYSFRLDLTSLLGVDCMVVGN